MNKAGIPIMTLRWPLQEMTVTKSPVWKNGRLCVSLEGDTLPKWIQSIIESNRVPSGMVRVAVFKDGCHLSTADGWTLEIGKPGKRKLFSQIQPK